MPMRAFVIVVPKSTATFNFNELMHMDIYSDDKETAGGVAWPGLVGLSPSSLGEIGCPFQKTACPCFCLPLPG